MHGKQVVEIRTLMTSSKFAQALRDPAKSCAAAIASSADVRRCRTCLRSRATADEPDDPWLHCDSIAAMSEMSLSSKAASVSGEPARASVSVIHSQASCTVRFARLRRRPTSVSGIHSHVTMADATIPTTMHSNREVARALTCSGWWVSATSRPS